MHIHTLYQRKKPVLSCEVFPPKPGGNIETVSRAIDGIAALSPDFMSVTYGAAGRGNFGTVAVAETLQRRHGVTALAHLTCVNATEAETDGIVSEIKQAGIENILALRGDLPEGADPNARRDFRYASDLIARLSGRGFSIGAAAYPEGHIDCESLDESIRHLRLKVESGAQFLLSQLFFDNDLFLRFLDKAGSLGLPISAGIMPILSRSQIERMIFLCGASLPAGVIRLLNRYARDEQSLRLAGIDYACRQAEDLAVRGADGIHIYAMNRVEVAQAVLRALR